jgi:hypothetical protein
MARPHRQTDNAVRNTLKIDPDFGNVGLELTLLIDHEGRMFTQPLVHVVRVVRCSGRGGIGIPPFAPLATPFPTAPTATIAAIAVTVATVVSVVLFTVLVIAVLVAVVCPPGRGRSLVRVIAAVIRRRVIFTQKN